MAKIVFTDAEKLKCRKLATTLRNSADRVFKRDIVQYNPTLDSDMVKLCVSDHRNAYIIAELMENGEIVKAARKVESLDTAARDEIPVTVFTFLTKWV